MPHFRKLFPYAYVEAATLAVAKAVGFEEAQVWSRVYATEESNGQRFVIYGPPRHSYEEGASYVCTRELHDNDTFYEEVLEGAPQGSNRT